MSVVSVPRCGSAMLSFARKMNLRSLAVLLGLVVAAASAHAATYTVSDTSDSASDPNSLRSAVNSVNAGSGGDTINIQSLGTITLTNGVLALNQNVTIDGLGAALLTISGKQKEQVFEIAAGVSATISKVSIADGMASLGAAIANNGGTLTVNWVAFSGNTASAAGAIYNMGNAILYVNNCTFSGNTATVGDGGGIYNSGGLTVQNSTFVGNTSAKNGGGISGNGSFTIVNSTITANTAPVGGGISANVGSTVTLTNSIIAGNVDTSVAGDDCDGCGTQSANNLISTSSSVVNPDLNGLQYNGGFTQTMMPLPGSPALGKGLSSTLATDQRGFIRATGNGSTSDLGAVQTYYLTVTDTTDTNDGNCTSSKCSLRDAINAADVNQSGDILFASGVNGTILLKANLIPATYAVNIVGPGASALTISGGTTYSIFQFKGIANVSGLTIANGTGTVPGSGIATYGGGILSFTTLMLSDDVITGNSVNSYGGGVAMGGVALIRRCTFSENIAVGSNAIGGGILALGPLSLTDSTFTGNTSSTVGGGLASANSTRIVNSTFTGNTANVVGNNSGEGGAIVIDGSAQIENATIVGNSAATSGGGVLVEPSRTVTITNSIVAGNTTTANVGDDCDSCGTQTAENIISKTGSVITAAQVNLGPLASNGEDQTVQTMVPLPGSLAITTGNPALLAPDITTDERGLPRTINSLLDVGAVQTNYTSIQFVQQPEDGWIGLILAPVTLSVTESGMAASNVSVPLTLSGSGVLSGTTTQTTVIPTGGTVPVALYNDLTVNTAGSDTLDASLTITPAAAATPVVLTATSSSFKVQPASFSITAAPASLTVTAGKSGTIVFTLTSLGGYNGTVTLSCGTLPAHSSCAFAPASVTLSNTPSTVTLTFATNLTTADLQWLPRVRSNNPLQGLPVLPAMLFWLPETVLDRKKNASKSEKKRMPKFLMMGAMVALTLGALAISGCGGSGSTPAPTKSTPTNVTPAGTQTVTITAAGTSNVTQTLAVSITVQ